MLKGSFYRVIETRVEVWEKREIRGNFVLVRVFPSNYEFLFVKRPISEKCHNSLAIAAFKHIGLYISYILRFIETIDTHKF
jgi:hypothetical protein